MLTGNAAGFPVQIITLLLLARILGAEGYGKFSLFLLLSNLIILFCTGWTSSALIRYGRIEYIKTDRINRNFWGRNAILFPFVLLSLCCIYIFKVEISRYLSVSSDIIWFLMVNVIGLTCFGYIQNIQQTIGQLKRFAICGFIEKIAIILVLLLVYLFFPKNLFSVISAYVVARLLVAIFFWGLASRDYLFPVEIKKETINRIFHFSFPFIFGSISMYIINWIDIIIIKHYMAISDVGTYSLAYRGMSVIWLIAVSLVTLLTPLMTTFLGMGREDLIIGFINRIIPQGVVLWNLLLSLVCVIAAFLIPLLFGAEFAESTGPFVLLMLGMGVYIIAFLYEPVLLAYELTKRTVLVIGMISVLNFLGDLLLVPYLGIHGAAIATSLAYSWGAMSFMFIANRELGLKKRLDVLLLLPIFFTVGLLWLTENIWVHVMGMMSIMLLTYFMVKVMNVFRKEDLNPLQEIEMPLITRRLIHATYRVLSK